MSGSRQQSAHPEEQTQLFSALAERLLEGEGSELPARRAHLLRLFSRLMPEASTRSRRDLVARLADMVTPPKDLALVMARDTPDISAPLLKYAPFSHDELVGLIARTGAEHHAEIAKRADLTLDVWLSMARAAARRASRHAVVGDAPDADTAESEDAAKNAPVGASAMPAGAHASRPQPDESPAGAMQTHSPQPEKEAPAAWRDSHPEAPHGTEPLRSTEPPTGAKSRQAPDPSAVRAEMTVHSRHADGEALFPLEDSDSSSWQFETDREGRIVRLSPNATLAFGELASGLAGQHLATVLQDFAASPAPDDVGAAMKRRAPIRDARVELQPPDAAPRRWRLRANPRFTFPDGRFEGYSGMAMDTDILDRPAGKPEAPHTAEELLDRLSSAAERLAQAADTPELRDYAVTMRDYARSLQTLAQTTGHGRLFPFSNNTSS